ncbi:MAG: hypothetical protein QOI01_6621 [Mycobacterium sp.]|jgi:hypothetical protein|nr:hypothetical protein [Mycobacterium sp.]
MLSPACIQQLNGDGEYMTQPIAGWFPDPSDPSRQRYFDGRVWTDSYAPFGAATPGNFQPAKPGMSRGMKIGLGLGAVVLAFIALGSFGSSDKSADTKSSSTTPTSSLPDKSTSTPVKPVNAVAAPAGSTVRDGKFEFQVLGVDRSATKAGIFKPEQAKGEFFIVRLRVTNIGDDARSFSASSQHLIVNGNKYDATSSISDENWMEDINPGLGVEASVTFDIPPGAVPEAIECHDSMFSGGALLAL